MSGKHLNHRAEGQALKGLVARKEGRGAGDKRDVNSGTLDPSVWVESGVLMGTVTLEGNTRLKGT